MTIDLRLGDYRTTLDGETWDAMICDPPYSERTHRGHNDGTSTADRLRDHVERMRAKLAETGQATTRGGSKVSQVERLAWAETDLRRAELAGATQRRPITYTHWTPDDVHAFVRWAHPRTRGWMVCMCDHVLAPHYVAAMESVGRYVFAPLVWYAPGSRVRMTGDGPACWVVYIIVSRPRSRAFSKWGSLPGGYSGASDTRAHKEAHIGGKPLRLMRDLVHDYSRPGDIVCDPFAGYGTTLVAARAEGRRAIGSELDAETYAIAARRCAELPPSTDEQPSLFGR